MLYERNKGFSLIEMLVATSIFMIIMIVVSGIYIRVLDLQRRAQGAARVQENILFVVETLSREIRVSQIVTADDASCTTSSIELSHPVNGTVEYQLAGGIIQRKQGIGAFEDLTSSEVEFTSFNLCIKGQGGDDIQARVTVLLTAESAASARHRVPFTIQTTIASRDLFVDLTN